MIDILIKLKNLGFKFSVIGGGTFNHISSQLNPVSNIIDYIFTENGTIIHNKNKCIKSHFLKDELNDNQTNLLVSFILKLLSKIIMPIKRGTFIEYRNGLINIAPMGRNCTLEEREIFIEFNSKENVLSKLKKEIEEFIFQNNMDLSVTFGGKISLDIFPKKWNKSMCLDFLFNESNSFNSKSKILFFGDKIYSGGNDYLLGIDKRVFGHVNVLNESDCENKLKKVVEFFSFSQESKTFNYKECFNEIGLIYN